MEKSLWREQILPFTVLIGLLALATLAGDYLLHRLNLVWVGRYLGIPGTILIIVLAGLFAAQTQVHHAAAIRKPCSPCMRSAPGSVR